MVHHIIFICSFSLQKKKEEGFKVHVLGNLKIEYLEALAQDTIDRCNETPIDVSLKENVP